MAQSASTWPRSRGHRTPASALDRILHELLQTSDHSPRQPGRGLQELTDIVTDLMHSRLRVQLQTKAPTKSRGRADLDPLDLRRISPYRAAWTCVCSLTTEVSFSRELQIGTAFPYVLTCKCGRRYRGQFITDLQGRVR
jgi:hypothetical protein